MGIPPDLQLAALDSIDIEEPQPCGDQRSFGSSKEAHPVTGHRAPFFRDVWSCHRPAGHEGDHRYFPPPLPDEVKEMEWWTSPCPGCGGDGCSRCGFTGSWRGRAHRGFMAALANGNTTRLLRGDCARCDLIDVPLTHPGAIIKLPVCQYCRSEIMGPLMSLPRGEFQPAIEEARKRFPW